MLSRSSAAHRARLRVNAATKASARSKVAHAQATAIACRARCLRLYHVDRETMSIVRRLPQATAVLPVVLGRCRAPCASAPSAGGLSRVVPRPSSLPFSESKAPILDLRPQRGEGPARRLKRRARALTMLFKPGPHSEFFEFFWCGSRLVL